MTGEPGHAHAMKSTRRNLSREAAHTVRPRLRSPGSAAGFVLACLWSAALLSGDASGQTYVPTADLQHPKVRYADSLVSMNDRCPVRKGKLSTTYKPVYVNGRPIGFC